MSSEAPRVSGSGRRQRIAIVVATACAIVSTGGLVASSFVKSPAEYAAAAAAPPAAPLSATVERRILSNTLVTRGTVAASTSVDVAPAAASGAAAQIVTAVKTSAGATVKAGQVLVAVSGRPLIALHGAIPGYRDLKPADTGDDVAQVQAALRELGHYHGGDRRGVFGAKTKAAVNSLYAKVGFQPATTGGPGDAGDRAALRAAQDAVDAAARAVADLKAEIASGRADQVAPQQLPELERTLARARSDQAYLVAHTGVMLPMGETVFLPAYPAQVTRLGAQVGKAATAPLLTITTGGLRVQAKLRPDQAALIKPGMRVELVAEALGTTAAGTVTVVEPMRTDAPAGTEAGAAASTPYVPMTIEPLDDLPSAWNGQDVRVTITSAQTAAEVLVVPLAAVSTGADGRTTVTLLAASGRTSLVEVVVGMSGDGSVEVRPVRDELHEGDLVVVGV